jgi:hypothetical protein
MSPEDLGVDPFEPFCPLDDANVPEFPTETQATWLGDHTAALSEETQTPADLAGLLDLGAISTAVAKRVRVKVRDGWVEPVNTYVAVALDPASRKSGVVGATSKPLCEWERDTAEIARPEVARHVEGTELLRERIKKLRTKASKGDDPEAEHEARELAAELAEREARAPRAPCLITTDCTPERMAALLQQQGGRMAIWTDEGGEIFEMIRGRYSGNSRPNMGVFLQAHIGAFLSVERTRGSIHVDAPALTIACTVQPSVIRALGDEKTFRERGRDWDAPPVPEDVSAAYHHHLRRLLDLPPVERTLELEPVAYEAHAEFGKALEPRLAEDGDLGSISDWAGKLAGQVARFAGLLHAAEWADQADPFAVPIDRTTMERAIKLGDYALGHARAAFAMMAADPRVEGAQKLWRYIARRHLSQVTRRELWQGTKGGRFRQVGDIDPCVGLLVEHGYLRAVGGNGGTRTETYAVNRKALEHEFGGNAEKSRQDAGVKRQEDEKAPLSYVGEFAPNTPNERDVGGQP